LLRRADPGDGLPWGRPIADNSAEGITMRLQRTMLFFLAAAGVMTAADSPFAGKWKLNPSKSQFAGITTTYEKLPSGEMRMTSEGQSYTFRVDGKEYPAIFGSTVIWKQVDANTWETINKTPGMQTIDTTRISADGKTMTVTSKGKKPNGEDFVMTSTSGRVSGGPGLAGQWKSTEVKTATEMWDIKPNGDDGLTMTLVDYNAVCAMKFDGKDDPATGPTVPKNFTLAIKKTSPRSLDMTEKMDGKVVYNDTFTVSADGKTLTDEAGAPGSSEKVKAVYDKQ
jgi:hypothetical protein